MSSLPAAPGLIVAASAAVASFLAPVLSGAVFPPFWSADDPIGFLRREAGGARIFVGYGGSPLSEAILDALPALKLIVSLGVGVDGMDPATLARRGITLVNAAGVNTEDVADLAIGIAIAQRRRIVAGDAWVRQGRWRTQGWMPETKSFSAMRPGIVGFGHIGKAISARLEGFGMRGAWWGPRDQPGARWPRAPSLLALAEASDLLFVAAPGSPANDGLVDRAVIESLGSEGLLVNIARGRVVDEAALIQALKAGRIGGAALDVFQNEPTDETPWRDLSHLVLTPHCGGQTAEAAARMKEMAADNIARFLAGAPLLNAVRSN